MEIIEYFESSNKAHWKEKIAAGDWSAAAYLARIIDDEKAFTDYFSEGGKVFLLTEGNELISFVTLSKTDCFDDDSLFPWLGFVYTFPQHRGHRYSQVLMRHAEEEARKAGYEKVYIGTDHENLYEKFGYTYMESRPEKSGEMSKIYFKKLKKST